MWYFVTCNSTGGNDWIRKTNSKKPLEQGKTKYIMFGNKNYIGCA